MLNEIADASRLAVEIEESGDAAPRGGQGVLRNPRPRPALSRQRGQARRRRAAGEAEAALAAMRAHPLGPDAVAIGRVIDRAEPAASPCARCSAARASSTCWSASSCRGSVEAGDARARHHPQHRRHRRRSCAAVGGSRRVTLEIGKLVGRRCADAIAFCFEIVSAGHRARGAGSTSADRRPRPLRGLRRRIRHRDACSALAPAAARRLERLAGEELNIKSMEIEEAA